MNGVGASRQRQKNNELTANHHRKLRLRTHFVPSHHIPLLPISLLDPISHAVVTGYFPLQSGCEASQACASRRTSSGSATFSWAARVAPPRGGKTSPSLS